MTFEIVAPTGSVKYDVPIVRLSDYTLDDLFEKNLYFLIPFYFFNLKKELIKYEVDEKALKEFERIFCEIVERVRETDESNLSDRSKRVIIRQMEEVVKRLAYNKENVIKKVGDIMGGRVIKMKWLEEYDAAVAEGEAKGKKEGEAERKALMEENKKLTERIKKLEADLKKTKAAML
ncbi:MAG: hypothetical protein K6B14_07515 [Lachnospiraceae bacterium]|nr:hypothetical protein [Lachnospiraceae bacterium]